MAILTKFERKGCSNNPWFHLNWTCLLSPDHGLVQLNSHPQLQQLASPSIDHPAQNAQMMSPQHKMLSPRNQQMHQQILSTPHQQQLPSQIQHSPGWRTLASCCHSLPTSGSSADVWDITCCAVKKYKDFKFWESALFTKNTESCLYLNALWKMFAWTWRLLRATQYLVFWCFYSFTTYM